jgi:hypothetical protein
MTFLGVFQDGYYNALATLASAQMNTTAQGNATILSASLLASAVSNYIVSTTATALTTDSAVNIIAQLQQAVAVAYKAQIAGFGAQVQPPLGAPNLFNIGFYVQIGNTAAALTLTAGAGVTFVGSAVVPTVGYRGWVVTITGPATVTFTTTGAVTTSFIA